MFGLPDFFGDLLAHGLEKEVWKDIASAAFSGYISGLWAGKQSKVSAILGLGQAERDIATSTWLALQPMVERGELVLTVPKELLDPDNLARFQTQEKK